SCLGLGLDYFIMALAPTVGWLFVGRVLSGITASSFTTSFAYIADVTEPDERARRFGILGAAFGGGFILGPAVGGLLGGMSLRAPFWTAGALRIVGAGLVGPAVRRLGEPRALLTGLACGALAFVVYGLAPNGVVFLLGIAPGSLYGLVYPSLQGLMTRRVGPDEQGQLQGALGSL